MNKQSKKESKLRESANFLLYINQLNNVYRRKLALYKEFTGIRWDVLGSELKREGLITDKKKYIHKLSYDKDLDLKILNDRFWNDVFECGKASEVNNPYKE